MGAASETECAVDSGADATGVVHGPRRLRHRVKQRRMIELLQCSRTPSAIWRAPTDEHQRGSVDPGSRDRADSISDTGTSRHHRQAGSARELARGLGGEDRSLLMADVDEPQRSFGTLLHGCSPTHGSVVERKHVGARKGEEGRGTVVDRCLHGLHTAMSGRPVHGQ